MTRLLAVVVGVGLALGCSNGNHGGESPSSEGGTGSSSGSASSSSGGSSSGSSSGGTSGSSSGGGASSSGSSSSGGGSSDSGGGEGGTQTSCTNPTCVVSNNGCTEGSYYLFDNQWNCGPSSGETCGPETLYGCSYDSWYVVSKQPAGNTAVLTFPSVQENFSNPLVSSFSAITSTFSEVSPHVGDYEVAYDIWLNDQKNEVMIWVDNYNQTPGGTKVASNVTLGPRTYDVWWDSSSGYIAFVATANFTSGTVDILQIFDYAIQQTWLPAGSTLAQINLGIEICSTNGQNATFSVDGFSITTN